MSTMASATVGNMYRVKPFFDTKAEIVSNTTMYKVKKYESGLTGISVSSIVACGFVFLLKLTLAGLTQDLGLDSSDSLTKPCAVR